MKGNTINEFIGDLLSMGGPEKEFIFRSQRYFLETIFNHKENINELVVFECCDKANPYIYRCKGKNLKDLVNQFEKAKIFDGMNIYEAEKEIEVIFG